MLDKLIEKLSKKYGGDDILLGLAESEHFTVKCIPTNLLGVDYVIGKPGVPAWRLTQIAGFEDSGKSLLAQWFLIQFQKRYENGISVLINTEYSFDPDFFEKLGGDLQRLIVLTPKTLEQTFKVFEDLVKVTRESYGSEPHIFAVIDSLSAAVDYEIEKGEYQPGIHARVLSQYFRRIKSQLYNWNATLVYISQNKEKIAMTPFGGGVARLGGHAVDFAPVLTLEIKRLKEDKGEIRYLTFKLKATKNHIAIPFREVELLFDLHTYKFVNAYNVLQILLQEKVITKDKGWYKYKNKSYRESELLEVLSSDFELEEEIRKRLNLELSEDILL